MPKVKIKSRVIKPTSSGKLSIQIGKEELSALSFFTESLASSFKPSRRLELVQDINDRIYQVHILELYNRLVKMKESPLREIFQDKGRVTLTIPKTEALTLYLMINRAKDSRLLDGLAFDMHKHLM